MLVMDSIGWCPRIPRFVLISLKVGQSVLTICLQTTVLSWVIERCFYAKFSVLTSFSRFSLPVMICDMIFNRPMTAEAENLLLRAILCEL